MIKKRNLLSIACILLAQTSLACPLKLNLADLALLDQTITRKHLKLFRIDSINGFKWEKLRTQIDTYNEQGETLSVREDGWIDKSVEPSDWLSFDSQGGSAFNKQLPLPCNTSLLVEIKDMSDSYLYLTNCPEDIEPEKSSYIKYSPVERLVEAPLFTYLHDEANHLMFDRISLKISDQLVPVAKDSRIEIRADFRSFFTISLDHKDIIASLNIWRQGAVSLIGWLEFKLKFLFLSFDLNLIPEAHFYKEGLYMPMIMHFPVDASKHVNPGSGIFYSWQDEPGLVWSVKQMPGLETTNKQALDFCDRIACFYELKGDYLKKSFSMRMRLPRYLVKNSFFPRFFTQKDNKNRLRSGFFFESSGLVKGSHHWDFWLDFNGSEQKCTARLKTRILSR